MSDPLMNSVTIGEGSMKIIAVHGWMGDHRLFAPLHPLIGDRDWQVAFPDCRGYGDRRQVTGAMTVEEIAADVLALADHLGWERFHMLGHSMAGMAAQRLMLDARDRMQSAMLLASVPASGARIDDARREMLLAALADPEARLRLVDANTGKMRDNAWLAKLRDLSLAGTRPDAMAAYMSSWTGAGFADALRGNDCPTTLIIGELDPGTPEAGVRQIYSDLLVNVRIDALPGTGHYAMQEAPDHLIAAMERHLTALA